MNRVQMRTSGVERPFVDGVVFSGKSDEVIKKMSPTMSLIR